MAQLLHSLSLAVTPAGMLTIFVGVICGFAASVVPGIGPATGIALLIPFTDNLSLGASLFLLASLYLAAMYGGSISAIMVGIPGDAPNAATVYDGYALTRQGRSETAIVVSITGAAIGGFIGIATLTFLGPVVGNVALAFGPSQMLALGIVGLSIVTGVTGDAPWRGLLGVLIGVLLALPGFDPLTGAERLTFGLPMLADGVQLVPFMLGLFAFGHALELTEEALRNSVRRKEVARKLAGNDAPQRRRPSLGEMRGLLPTYLRSAVLGTSLSAIPGHGATISSLYSYEVAKQLSKNRSEFGQGSLKGVAAPETAAASAVGGALIPALTLGIPGSASTAVILAALALHGVPIGASMFAQHQRIAYSLSWGLLFALVFIVCIGYFGRRILARIASIPIGVLVPLVMGISVIGSYALRSDIGDTYTMIAVGILSYILRRNQIPLAPVVMGFILEPIIELSLRRSLIISGGSLKAVVDSPLSVGLYCIAFALAVLPLLWRAVRGRRNKGRVPDVMAMEEKPGGETKDPAADGVLSGTAAGLGETGENFQGGIAGKLTGTILPVVSAAAGAAVGAVGLVQMVSETGSYYQSTWFVPVVVGMALVLAGAIATVKERAYWSTAVRVSVRRMCWQVVVFVGAGFGYVWLLETAGYLLPTIGFLAVGLLLLRVRRPIPLVVVPVVFPVVAYLLFHAVLGIQLPSGFM